MSRPPSKSGRGESRFTEAEPITSLVKEVTFSCAKGLTGNSSDLHHAGLARAAPDSASDTCLCQFQMLENPVPRNVRFALTLGHTPGVLITKNPDGCISDDKHHPFHPKLGKREQERRFLYAGAAQKHPRSPQRGESWFLKTCRKSQSTG